MIYSYSECINRFGTDYFLNCAIQNKKIFKVEKGWYSDSKNVFDKELITRKYPNAVFCGKSAFYYYGLTDEIPDTFSIATRRNSSRISDKKIEQTFVKDELFEVGITTINIDGSNIRIYDKERMLIELIRSRSKLPFDYYKEIIRSYRNEVNNISFAKLNSYLRKFKNGDKILEIIQLEVL